MKRVLAIALVLAAPAAESRTWQQAFDEAVELRSKSMCEKTYRSLNDQCNLAGIYPGGQNYDRVLACKDEAQQMRQDCLDDIDGLLAEDREAAQEAARQAQEDKQMRDDVAARRQEVERLNAIAGRRAPDLELSCTRVSSARTGTGTNSNDPNRFFQPVIVLQVWNEGACLGSLGTSSCAITASSIQGHFVWSGSFTVSRVTGQLAVSNRDLDIEATYNCQKSSAATNKF